MTSSRKELMYQVLVKPVVSEKASFQSEQGKIVFEVQRAATKKQIKSAVEALFSVKVARVNTLVQKGKSKRFGRSLGVRSDRKKAFVTLIDAVDFDIFDAQVR